MPRVYGHKFLLELQNGDPVRLGTQLGRACVEANLPAAYIAKTLEVSKTTIYAWFRGQGVRENKRATIEALIRMIEEGLQSGLLPATSVSSAKLYLRDTIGVEI